jgi:hypothetical protein
MRRSVTFSEQSTEWTSRKTVVTDSRAALFVNQRMTSMIASEDADDGADAARDEAGDDAVDFAPPYSSPPGEADRSQSIR